MTTHQGGVNNWDRVTLCGAHNTDAIVRETLGYYYSGVHRGAHRGTCDVCSGERIVPATVSL